MNPKTTHILLYAIRILLMVFWLYVALDKLWDLEAFHRALLRQPFPDWWADVLYWSLPMAELGIALLFILIQPKKNHRHSAKRSDVGMGGSWPRVPYLLSTALLLIFTLYIALGVAGLYAQRPCGCASVFSGLSWDRHLVVNLLLLALSILGWYLTGPTAPMDSCAHDSIPHQGYPGILILLRAARPIVASSFKRLFPRRFAPFPGRPVHYINLIRAAVARQMAATIY